MAEPRVACCGRRQELASRRLERAPLRNPLQAGGVQVPLRDQDAQLDGANLQDTALDGAKLRGAWADFIHPLAGELGPGPGRGRWRPIPQLTAGSATTDSDSAGIAATPSGLGDRPATPDLPGEQGLGKVAIRPIRRTTTWWVGPHCRAGPGREAAHVCVRTHQVSGSRSTVLTEWWHINSLLQLANWRQVNASPSSFPKEGIDLLVRYLQSLPRPLSPRPLS